VLLLAIFPRGHNPVDPKTIAVRTKIDQINQQLSKLDDGQKTHYLDINSKFLQPDGTIAPATMKDFLHPTPAGYQIWADAMQPTLDDLMK
jgi:lysophospholipase L1-like esterase